MNGIGLDLKSIFFMLLALFIVFGIFKRLFKLVIFVVIAGIVIYLIDFLI